MTTLLNGAVPPSGLQAQRLATRELRLVRPHVTCARFHPFPSRQSRFPSRALPAFSLVELIVGAIIAALVAGATASSLSMLLKSRATSANRQQAFARADAAASRIASDAATLIRDPVLAMARVRVQDQGGDANPHDDLLMLVRSVRPIRSSEEGAEGGEYEVQYRVEGNSFGPRSNESLWRRIDHAFDDNQEGGGIASAIVPHVASLSVEAYDGESWYPSWDSDSDGYPHALRVIVRATSDDASVFATARRVVAIDRTPLPPPEEDDSNPDTKNQPSAASSSPSTSSAGSTTPRATPTAPNPRGNRNPGNNRIPGAGNTPGNNRNPGAGGNPNRGGANNPGNRGGGNQGPRPAPAAGGAPRGGGG